MLYYFDYLIFLCFVETKFMFTYSLCNCILKNEDKLPAENQDDDINSIFEQMRMSTSNATLVDSVQSNMQRILLELFTIKKPSMLSLE